MKDQLGEQDRRSTTMTKRFSARANARQFIREESTEGQAIVEYSLIFVLIIIVCFSIVTLVSDSINDNFFKVVQTILDV
jgi:Flp pilus assembly pilin Flp